MFFTKIDSFIAQNINFVGKHPQIMKVLLIFLVNIKLFCFGIKRIFGKQILCVFIFSYLFRHDFEKKGIRLKKFFGLLGNFACCFALCFKLSTRCIFTRFLRRETERVHSSCFFCYWCLLGKYHSCMKGRRHSATGCLQRSRHGSSFFLFSLLTFTQFRSFNCFCFCVCVSVIALIFITLKLCQKCVVKCLKKQARVLFTFLGRRACDKNRYSFRERALAFEAQQSSLKSLEKTTQRYFLDSLISA